MWGRAILIAALVIIIGLPAWGIYSCANKSTSVSAPVPTPPAIPANAIVEYFDISEGKWATGSDRMVMISSLEKVTSFSTSYGQTFEAPSGKTFLFVSVTSRNIGNTSFMTGPGYFQLTDSKGQKYKDQTYSNYHFSKPYPNASLSPLITVTGKILWMVPISASELEISYLLEQNSSPPVVAKWKIPP
jgi:hypothetical protein